MNKRSINIMFSAIFSIFIFLPSEINEWFKKNIVDKGSVKIIIAVLILLSIVGFISITDWNTDATKAKIKFDIGGPFGTVHGSFSGLKTTIVFNENDLTGSSILASIQAGTVNTGIGLRNRDLREKEEWLDTKKYPMISFHSMKIVKTSEGYKAMGNLTMKSITKPVEIPFTFKGNGHSGLFKGRFEIKRRDFNVGREGGSVGSTMTIMLEVPVSK